MGGFSIPSSAQHRLERQLKQTRDVRVYQRTLAVLERQSGRSVAEIAAMLRVSRQVVYQWLEAYGESLDPESLKDEPRGGRPRRWSDECTEWLLAFLSHSPAELGYPAVNWTVALIQDALQRCTSQQFCSRTFRRELQRAGYVWKRPRYVLDPDPEREKKATNSPRNWTFGASHGVAC